VAAAQPPQRDSLRAYVDALRADLSNGKVKTINDVMKLSDEEARVFWPISKDYEDELFENGDRRVALIKEYSALAASHALIRVPRDSRAATGGRGSARLSSPKSVRAAGSPRRTARDSS
jgi:hypothetical protein